MKHMHNLGDRIEAQDISSLRWRAGFVMQFADYRGRPGYYVSWDLPRDTPSWISRGGWQPESSTRPYVRA